MKHVNYDALDSLSKKALDEAKEAMEKAYSPYSHFYVGAALFTDDGTVISGSNFENAAYGPTICAERSAVVRANAMGIRRFQGIAISLVEKTLIPQKSQPRVESVGKFC